jgi:hypothetical protein
MSPTRKVSTCFKSPELYTDMSFNRGSTIQMCGTPFE